MANIIFFKFKENNKMNSWIPWENGTLLECTSGSYWKFKPILPLHVNINMCYIIPLENLRIQILKVLLLPLFQFVSNSLISYIFTIDSQKLLIAWKVEYTIFPCVCVCTCAQLSRKKRSWDHFVSKEMEFFASTIIPWQLQHTTYIILRKAENF